MRTPVVVIHPCTLFHDGLRQTLKKSRFGPVHIATTPSKELEAYLRSLKSCIWLIGVERCVPATNDLVQRVVTSSPGVKPIILAAYQVADDILAALKAGACGFLCQNIPGEQLIKSLELIALGETVVHPRCSWEQTAVEHIQASREMEDDNRKSHAKNGGSYLIGHSNSRSPAPLMDFAMEPLSESQAGDSVPSLSRREMLILRMLMEGASNKVIALKLVITESTVKVHMKAILAQTSTAESYTGGDLGAQPCQRGIIECPDAREPRTLGLCQCR